MGALRYFVAPFAQVLVTDDAVRVDKAERRPVVVVERDRVVDLPLVRRQPRTVDLVFARELRRVHADHHHKPSS
jgi:hypothetical protein